MNCGHGHGKCKAPDTQCPHWQGIFCELDSFEDKSNKLDAIIAETKAYEEERRRVLLSAAARMKRRAER